MRAVTAKLLVTVVLPDSVSAGPDTAVCENSGILTLNGQFPAAGGTWSGIGIVNGNQFNPAIAGVGSAVLTYTIGVDDCEIRNPPHEGVWDVGVDGSSFVSADILFA